MPHLDSPLERVQAIDREIRETIPRLHGNDVQLRLILRMAAQPLEEAAKVAKKRQEAKKG